MMHIKEDAEFGCHLFKIEQVSDLLHQIDERVDIIEQVSDDLKRIEGVNVIELWRLLYKRIRDRWIVDPNQLFITLSKSEEVILHFVADLVAQFFLYNGSEIDDKFLKSVSAFFDDVNLKYGIMTPQYRWGLVLKSIIR